MTLGEIVSRAGSAIGLSTATGSDELSKLYSWANEAVVQFLRETKCYVLPFDPITLTEGVGDYAISSDILAWKSLYIVGQQNTLERSSSDEILARRAGDVGVVTPYLYAMEGENLLMLYPLPAADNTLGGLYVPRPTAMTLSTHDPSSATYGGVPSEFHDVLEAYTKWRAADWDDDTSSKIGQAYRQEWLEGVVRSKIATNKKAGVRLGPARVKRSRRWASSPGVDIG